MSTEIWPASSDGIETSTQKNWTRDRGEEVNERKTGPNTGIEAAYEAAKLTAQANSNITSLQFSDDRGRGTLTTIYSSTDDPSNPDQSVYGVQELIAIDVLKDIELAPYFESLDYYSVNEVHEAIAKRQIYVTSSWSALQKTLFHHLSLGQDTYYETSFVFRKTRRIGSGQTSLLKAVMTDINTVVALPELSPSLLNIISGLPTGQWLKRPTQVRYIGRDGWDVSEEYQWSLTWSVVYGGTWTGE